MLGCIPVIRPQDVQRINGVGMVTVIEDGMMVTGEELGKQVQVGDMLYVEFEGPDNKDILKEACGAVEEIIDDNKVRIKKPGMRWLTKGRRKGQLRRLVDYGSFKIRVERGSTLKTLENLNLPKSLSSSLSKSFERLSSSPGVLPPQIHDKIPEEQSEETTNHPPNSSGSGASECTPLLAEGSSNQSNRSTTTRSILPPVPSIPTTFTYTHLPPHSEVYSAVYNHFSQSQSVCIYPEGISHDSEHMMTLKYGCAVMSLGYLASKEPDALGRPRKLKLVPCGLNFFNRHRFRSRVFIEVGQTIEINEELIEMYRAGKDSKRQACKELLNIIQKSLSELTVNAPSYNTLLFFKTASRLYREKLLPRKLDFSEKLALLRRIAKKYSSTNPPSDEARTLKRDVVSYVQRLRDHHLSPHHTSTTPISLFVYLPLFLILIILTIPGLILFCPIGLVARYVGKRQGENAMLYDDNSLAITRWPGRDVIATWKMMTGIPLFIIFDFIYSILTIKLIRRFDLYEFDNKEQIVILGACLFLFFWTTVAYGTVLLWESMCWVGKKVWIGLWCIFNPKYRQSFTREKEELSIRVWKWLESNQLNITNYSLA
ncbi:16733_t:CDS:2 [Acaulospora morrowiae]|uniref:16733_t:CDS:1 n=1 Tax=Acaulospora morrowiae TaxID=94023 RepID=A0A9N9HT68_9GLOM|nr:16733_t:CDS:2 [Acaulospora morrowiae]